MSNSAGNQDQLIRNLKRQLLIERLVIASAAVAFLARYAFINLLNVPYSIQVNGKPVAYVESRKAAERVIATVRRGPGARFREKVEIRRGSRDDRAGSERTAEQALRRKANLLVEGWAIVIDGKVAAALPSEEQASGVLDRAREHFGAMVGNLMEVPTFKEKVHVEPATVEAALLYSDVDKALRALVSATPTSGTAGIVEHVVQNGQVAARIAKRYGLSGEQLARLNPGRNLDRLQIGDKLVVGRANSDHQSTSTTKRPRLTVVVRDSVSRIESVPYSVETISSMQMPKGKRLVLSPGRPGSRRVKRAVIYENGVKIRSEIVEETLLSPPRPERVAIGIGKRR